MTLRGSIASFPLETIVQLIAATAKTGQLDVRSGSEGGALGFADGRLVSAVAGNDVGDAALGAIFTIADGDFDFQPWGDAPGSNLTGDLNELLDRAVEQRDKIVADRTVIPDDRMRFRLSDRAAQSGEVRLSSDQWRTLLAVNGERDVNQIAGELNAGRLATLATLAELVRGGIIEVLEPSPEPPAEPEPTGPSRGSETPTSSFGRAAAAPPAETTRSWDTTQPAEPARARPDVEPMAPWQPPAEPESPRSWEEVRSEPIAPWQPPAEPETPRSWDTPATDTPPWDTPATEPEMPRSWDTPAASWQPPATETPAPRWEETPAAETPAPASDKWWERPGSAAWERPTELAPEPEAPAAPAFEPEPARAPEPARDADDRLSALSGLFGGAAQPAPPAWQPPPPPPPAAEPVVAPLEPRPAAPEEPKKKGGLFGGLFRSKPEQPAPAAPSPIGATHVADRCGRLAAFANALLDEYNSGSYGKGRIDDRIANLLMRVDEQADPIDRPLPIVDDRIDASALDRAKMPDRQVAPYLALLVTQIYEDAERTFGKDKARQGYRNVRQQVLGGDTATLGTDLSLPRV
ncbi:MAG TPA: DUF4388 domain-containing protein [Candidatus Limnocylindria bacterium]|nr:DUF4388 domain-containing protein [Candidatus Limnocylindria bacterium]